MMDRSYTDAPAQLSSGSETDVGDRYWRDGTRFALPASLRHDQVDEPAYRDLTDYLPTLCWVANADGYITWYSRRWHDYCGTTPEQMEGWGWQSVHNPDASPAVMAEWKLPIDSGEPFEMVFPLRGADGLFRPFLTRIMPVRDEAGIIRRWIGDNVDISAQIEAEADLRRSQQELETAHRPSAEREAFLSSVLASSTD